MILLAILLVVGLVQVAQVLPHVMKDITLKVLKIVRLNTVSDTNIIILRKPYLNVDGDTLDYSDSDLQHIHCKYSMKDTDP